MAENSPSLVTFPRASVHCGKRQRALLGSIGTGRILFHDRRRMLSVEPEAFRQAGAARWLRWARLGRVQDLPPH